MRNIAPLLLFQKYFSVNQILQAGTRKVQSTFATFYLGDVTHKSIDTFSIRHGVQCTGCIASFPHIGYLLCWVICEQCLCYLAPLMKYFIREDYPPNINQLSSYVVVVAKEVGAVLKVMITVRRDPISLMPLKNKVGELHHQFMSCRQHDSHEFLMFLLTWLHEDLMGGDM